MNENVVKLNTQSMLLNQINKQCTLKKNGSFQTFKITFLFALKKNLDWVDLISKTYKMASEKFQRWSEKQPTSQSNLQASEFRASLIINLSFPKRRRISVRGRQGGDEDI